MKTSAEILTELKELNSFLAEQQKVNVFSVPDKYFEILADAILIAVKDENDVIKNIATRFSAEVPTGYFDNLATTILDKIKAQQKDNAANELRVLSPMLYSIQNENVFEVPKGYFNDIADAVFEKVAPKKAKVTVLHKRSLLLQYAAAAVVLSFVTFSIFKFTVNHNTPAINIASTLDPSIETGKSMNNAQFDTTLNNLSQADIASYLEKNGNESDIAELTSNIDTSSLPTQDDYLVDQTALEKYLSDGNIKQTDN